MILTLPIPSFDRFAMHVISLRVRIHIQEGREEESGSSKLWVREFIDIFYVHPPKLKLSARRQWQN